MVSAVTQLQQHDPGEEEQDMGFRAERSLGRLPGGGYEGWIEKVQPFEGTWKMPMQKQLDFPHL